MKLYKFLDYSSPQLEKQFEEVDKIVEEFELQNRELLDIDPSNVTSKR